MRKLILLGVGMLFAGAAQAQFGIKAGPTAATFFWPSVAHQVKYRFSYHIGVLYERALNPRWSVQPELQYARQGAQVFRPSGWVPGDEYLARLDYLLLPVLVKRRFARFYVEAGPQLGYLAAGRKEGYQVVISPADGYYLVGYTHKARADYHHLDLSAAVGAGATLEAGLAAGVRYTAGLNHLDSDAVQNRTLQV